MAFFKGFPRFFQSFSPFFKVLKVFSKVEGTWHADTSESAAFIEARAIVLARIGIALVDVDLAPGSGESSRAVALERSRSVDAQAVVLAR